MLPPSDLYVRQTSRRSRVGLGAATSPTPPGRGTSAGPGISIAARPSGPRGTSSSRPWPTGRERTIDKLLRPGDEVAAFNRSYDEDEAARRLRVGRGPAGLVAAADDPHAASAPGEDDALLAQPLRHQPRPGGRSHGWCSEHVQLLRSHALGRFQPLLEEVTHDPADAPGPRSRRQPQGPAQRALRPGLLEVFTLGPGSCPEQDIQEAARALTGWFVVRNELRFIPREHDAGPKRILGQEGPFEVKDVVRIALAQTATPRHLVRKLYRWLITETDEPDDALLAPLAESFAKDYDVAAAGRDDAPLEPVLLARPRIAGGSRARWSSPWGSSGAGGQRPRNGPGRRNWPGWGRTSTSRRRSAAGRAAGRGSTRRRWWAAATWPGAWWPAASRSATSSTRSPSPRSTASAARSGRRSSLLDLFLQGDCSEQVRDKVLSDSSPQPAASLSDAAPGPVALPESQSGVTFVPLPAAPTSAVRTQRLNVSGK